MNKVELRRRVLRAKALRRKKRLEKGIFNYQESDPRHPKHPEHAEHMRFIKLLYLLRVSLPQGESIFNVLFPRQTGTPKKTRVTRKPIETHKVVDPSAVKVFTPFRLDGLGDKNAG